MSIGRASIRACTASRRPPTAHWIVGVGEEHQLRPLAPHRFEQRGRVLAVLDIGHRHQTAAISGNVEVEGRIGPERGDDGIARLGEQAHRVAEQRVDAFADHDVRGRQPQFLRQRRLQIVILGIAIHPAFGRRLSHGGDGFRRRAEDALVGAEPGPEHDATRALLRLRADERHRRGQRGDDRRIAWLHG